MRHILSNHPVVSLFFVLVLLGSPVHLSAETQTEAVSEGVADVLGELHRQPGGRRFLTGT
jgi:hypothetical protein